MRKLVVLGMALALHVAPVHAQATATTGSEPPVMGKSAPPPPSVAPKADGNSFKLSPQELEAKISDLTRRFKQLEGRIGLGKGVVESWAGIAEKQTAFGQSVNKALAECELAKARAKDGRAKGFSSDTMAQLIEDESACKKEVARKMSVLNSYANEINVVAKEVSRIEEEVNTLGAAAEKNVNDRKSLEAERSLGGVMDKAKTRIQEFDPQRKRLTN